MSAPIEGFLNSDARWLRRFKVAAAGLILLMSLAWLLLDAYQSHYVAGLRILGDDTTQTLIGEAKEGRGDEWSTYIPFLKQAYLEGFPERSSLEPYRERFDWFITLPSRDASLVLLPNQLAYWMLSGGTALSFQGLYYNLLLLLSAFWLLRNLNIRVSVACAASVVLLFNQLYQVWWTSNFPALGASILPFAVLTSSLRWRLRGPLLAWSIGHMLLGQLYPPFYFSLAVAVAPFVLAVRPDLLHWRNLLLASVSVAVGCAAVIYFKMDYVEAVSGTTYPGLRISTGGDASFSTLLGVLFPTYPASSAHDVGATLYELSVVGSFFSLLAIAVLPAVEWSNDVVRTVLVSVAVLAVLIVYMLFGFPEPVAKFTGFFMAPGRRIQLGFSVLVLFLSAYLISNSRKPISPIPLLVVFGVYACSAYLVGSRPDLADQFFAIRWYPYLAIVLVCVAGAISWVFTRGRQAGAAMVAALVVGMPIAHVIIYGSFNPIMDASTILRRVDSQTMRDWKALYKMNHEQPFGVVGNYGHLLRGEGVPALEAIHLVNTDREIYAQVFPEVRVGDRDRLFNQFRGIGFRNVSKYDAAGLTAFFPARLHSVPFPHDIDSGRDAGTPLNHAIELGSVERKDLSRFVVYWKGALISPTPIDTRLRLKLDCKVDASWLTRYPTGGAKLPGDAVSLQGMAGELLVFAGSEEAAAKCVRKMIISDPGAAPVAAVVPQRVAADEATLRAGLEWSGKACDLNVPEVMKVHQGGTAFLDGYVISPSNAPAGDFDIVLRGRHAYQVAGRTGVRRPDVAQYFDNPQLEASGFHVAVKFEGVAPGAYAVEFHMTDGVRESFCETGKVITVD